jgi:hypothetical protein
MSTEILNHDIFKMIPTFSDNLYIRTKMLDNNLYLNIINILDGYEYEINIDIRDLNSPFGKNDTYFIILNSFKKLANYSFTYKINPNNINIKIKFLFNTFLDVLFNIKVPRLIKENYSKNNFEYKNNIEILKKSEKHSHDVEIINDDILSLKKDIFYLKREIRELKSLNNENNEINKYNQTKLFEQQIMIDDLKKTISFL